MAAEGVSVGTILLAGGWSSVVFLRCAQQNEIDQSRFMDATIDESGDENYLRAPDIDPVEYLERMDSQGFSFVIIPQMPVALRSEDDRVVVETQRQDVGERPISIEMSVGRPGQANLLLGFP